MAHIGRDEGGFRAEAAKLGFERPAFRLAAAGNDDGGAFPGEGQRRGAADAGECAGDENN